jgi:predicted amidohydrolase
MSCLPDGQAGSPSREENVRRARERIAEAAKRGARIVCLPELFLSRYFCQEKGDRSAFELAETIPGPTTEQLGDVAARHRIVLIGGSILERGTNGNFYNTAPVLGPDGTLLGAYRKTHIPEDPRYHERHYFSPGDTGIRVFETPFGAIAVLICYDQWFPEAARIAVLKGAEIIFYPTAIGHLTDEEPEEGNWQKAWEDIQRGHAIANSVYIAAVNRIGIEGKIAFFGGSFVSDPFGNVLARAGSTEEVLIVSCDLSKNEELREGWGFLRNRRPDAYGELIEESGKWKMKK